MAIQDHELKRLYYRSAHRGCKETDLVFARFVEKQLHSLSEGECAAYAELLEEDDAHIWDWLLGHVETPPQYGDLMARLQACIPVNE